MEVEGKRILDSNYYQQVTIHDKRMIVQRYDKVGRLVCKDFGPKRTRSKQAISSRMKKCDDETVKAMAVDYFLDYNKICSIYENSYVQGIFYPLIIDSTIGKRLRFKALPSDEIWDKIECKYRFNRDEFLINLEGYCKFAFGFDVDRSSYEIKGMTKDWTESLEEDKTREVLFCLSASQDENFVPYVREEELEFFGRAISVIMGDQIADIEEIRSTDRFGFILKEYAIVDKDYYNRSIHIASELVPAAEKFVSAHNQRVWSKRREEEKIEGKIYQMKLEEF